MHCILHRIPRALQTPIPRALHTSTTAYQEHCILQQLHTKSTGFFDHCIPRALQTSIPRALHTSTSAYCNIAASMKVLAGPLPVLETRLKDCSPSLQAYLANPLPPHLPSSSSSYLHILHQPLSLILILIYIFILLLTRISRALDNDIISVHLERRIVLPLSKHILQPPITYPYPHPHPHPLALTYCSIAYQELHILISLHTWKDDLFSFALSISCNSLILIFIFIFILIFLLIIHHIFFAKADAHESTHLYSHV